MAVPGRFIQRFWVRGRHPGHFGWDRRFCGWCMDGHILDPIQEMPEVPPVM